MKKRSNIFGFVLPIVVIIALLVIQALCDLELPSYTSDIINNGIQQGGIDSAIPDVLTEDIYTAIIRMTDEEKIISSSYELYETSELSSNELTELNVQNCSKISLNCQSNIDCVDSLRSSS